MDRDTQLNDPRNSPEMDCWLVSNPVCPFCKHENDGWWEWGLVESEHEKIECGSCEKEYFVYMVVSHDFSSTKPEPCAHRFTKDMGPKAPEDCYKCRDADGMVPHDSLYASWRWE